MRMNNLCFARATIAEAAYKEAKSRLLQQENMVKGTIIIIKDILLKAGLTCIINVTHSTASLNTVLEHVPICLRQYLIG